MGNISSALGRAGEENFRENSRDENGNERSQTLSGEDFISDSVSGSELNHHDYQMTLHQYLSQRYADRYNNSQYELVQLQQQQPQQPHQQRQRSHENQTNSEIQQNKETLTKSSSFSQSTDLIVLSLKGNKIKEVPPELFFHDEVTSLDLSQNGNNENI